MAYIILNKNNFFHNLDIIVKQVGSKEKVAIVLKDNAYGHGLVEIAMMAKEYGITKCVVQTVQEAVLIESFFDYILVLADLKESQNDKIRYTINDIDTIPKLKKGTKVELKVDTGMHRNGIIKEDLLIAFQKIKKYELHLEALFTHHRCADELTSEWFWQKDIFKVIKKEALKLAQEYDFKDLKFHSSNSASLFRTKFFDEDMVRVGIAAYGCMLLPKGLQNDLKFKPVLSLYASKISSRQLKKGQKVGYGGTYIAKKDEIISNYDFGYGEGFLRVLSNTFQTPTGEKIVGRISMDNSSFLSDKDELLIFDDATIVAQYAKIISYEVLTSLKANITRTILK